MRQTAFLLSRDWHLAQDLTQITLAQNHVKVRSTRALAKLRALLGAHTETGSASGLP